MANTEEGEPKADEDTVTRRYLALVRYITSTIGEREGSQAEVARLLGISPAYLSQLLSGARDRVGARVIRSATSSVPLVGSRDYFYKPGPDPDPAKFVAWGVGGEVVRRLDEVFREFDEEEASMDPRAAFPGPDGIYGLARLISKRAEEGSEITPAHARDLARRILAFAELAPTAHRAADAESDEQAIRYAIVLAERIQRMRT